MTNVRISILKKKKKTEKFLARLKKKETMNSKYQELMRKHHHIN